MPEAKVYIGDGVYAEYDGFGVWLTTERENGTHRIYLEPSMLDVLADLMGCRPSGARDGA